MSQNDFCASDGSTRVDFDRDGPRIGSIPLLTRGVFGFVPRTSEELEKIFSGARRTRIDVHRLQSVLASVALALNKGDLGLAAVAASRLPLPPLLPTNLAIAEAAETLLKASPDDPERPGYPAGAPDRKGGQFRPKDVPGSISPEDRLNQIKRLAQRRALRSVLRRVLTFKRVLRIVGRYVEGELVQDVPVLNDLVGMQSLGDDLDLLQALSEDVADSDAAIDFAKDGPYELSQLQKSPDQPQSFSSFNAFKKIEIEKQFGSAGDGFDYHHIVEQGPNARDFSQSRLQSTSNIVRIPRLLHEEINSMYNSVESYGGELTTARLYLRGKSFEAQREFGMQQLRKVGALH